VIGVASGWSLGWVLLPVGAFVGFAGAAFVLPRRMWVEVDDHGIRSSSVRHVHQVTWSEVRAIGVVPSRMGRSARSYSAGVCIHDQDQVLIIPALTVRSAPLQRLGDEAQQDRLDADLAALLDPLRLAAAAHDVPVVEGDLVAWWDQVAR
jgi:hypothetical protein